PAIVPASGWHTGVKFLGCENRTAQPFPIQSWKLIVPWVVSAVKSGAVSLMRKLIRLSSNGTRKSAPVEQSGLFIRRNIDERDSFSSFHWRSFTVIALEEIGKLCDLTRAAPAWCTPAPKCYWPLPGTLRRTPAPEH